MREKLLGLQADLFRALGHPTRLRILELLAQGERCVCEMLPALGLEQPNVSQHLAILRQAGLISSRRDGPRVVYQLVNPGVGDLLAVSRGAVQHTLREASRLVRQS